MSTNFFNLIGFNRIKKLLQKDDLIAIGTRDSRFIGDYQPTAITVEDFIASIPIQAGGVQSVTDDGTGVVQVDNADPSNPIVVFKGISSDGSTIDGDGTPGDPLKFIAPISTEVKYANVLFVDTVNGNDATGIENDLTKPYSTITAALSDAVAQGPIETNRTLIYVRRGLYSNDTYLLLQNFIDVYCEPGVIIFSTSILDNGNSVNCRWMGKANFRGNTLFTNQLLGVTGATSKVYFEFDDLFTSRAAFIIQNGASVTITGRKVFAETFNTGFGATFRGSGTIVLNITEEFAAWHNVIVMRFFSGKAYVTCPRLYLHEGNYYGGNFKAVLHIYDNSGGELTVNGDLIVNNIAGYYGGTSSVITRWVDSWLTVRVNGNLFCENQFGVYGLGSSSASRTIINGDVKTNNLVCYVASNSTVVFRNGTLLNNNTTTGSEGYPVMGMGQNGNVWVENCHIHSLGAANATVSAFWKDTTTATLNVYNSVYSAADATGFFIRNNAGGQPVNNVRILNCRSTKPLDTNITDLLTPTGFTQDSNIQSINFV